MRLGRLFVASVLLAGIAGTAAAQNFKFKSGTPYSPQPTLWGYYVSPYSGQFLSAPGQPTVDIWCVDFFHEVHNGDTWNATFTNMGSSDFSNTYGMRFRGWSESIAEERYKAAAWLATQFDVPTSSMDPGNKTAWPGYQAAIWGLMGRGDPNASLLYGRLTETQGDMIQSALEHSRAGDVDGTQWTVISDTKGYSGATQEFIAKYNVVPEPATILLLATGLAAIAGLAYFRGFAA